VLQSILQHGSLLKKKLITQRPWLGPIVVRSPISTSLKMKDKGFKSIIARF
jgi:hypothetical protein